MDFPVEERGVETLDQVAVVTLDYPPVNALSVAVRTAVVEGVKAAEADPNVKAIVLIGAGRGFSGGADITEFTKPPMSPSLHDVLAIVEASRKPTVAAIHGVAFGGGLELVLTCTHRVASPDAKLGLPEVKLGILPGAAGTQRLPRVVGVERALEMIVSGDPIGAETARDAGLVDELIEGDLKAGAVAFARKLADAGAPLVRTRDRDDKIAAARADMGVFDRFKAANARRFRGFIAPSKCLEAVKGAVELPFEEGQKLERKLFMELLQGEQSAAQRYAFFSERTAGKVADVPEGAPTIPIRKVGVLGAGTMGGGISMNFLNAGIPVTMVEVKAEALERGVGIIRKNYDNTAKKGRLTPADVETRMGLLSPTLDFDKLGDCDLIIEAVFEDMAIKKDVFTRLDKVAKPGAILASNTSYLDVNEIASVTSRPESVIGLHFFSPANVMRLLEVVRGAKTDKTVVATAMALGKKIGKVAVLVGVCHGFVGNRMLATRQIQANQLLLEGAMPWDIDRVMTDFGMPMGPFAMGDLAGLDIGWNRATSSSSNVREVLCEMGRLGQKSGGGFYDYDAERRATPSPVAEKIIRDFAAKQGVPQRDVSDQEILERLVYPMINEGAKILEEGIAQRASDIDVVWINGYGWPVYRGGPMFYADTIGAAKIVERLKAYQAQGGEDEFKPTALLEKLAAEGKRFQDL
jgi:3-hydroxyacyl-CoA dehydrogenase